LSIQINGLFFHIWETTVNYVAVRVEAQDFAPLPFQILKS